MDLLFRFHVFFFIFMLVKRSAGSSMQADWMSKLPKDLLRVPLRGIAIPGSHDSASYSLNINGDLAPGIPREVRDFLNVSKALKNGEHFVRREIYRWSVTQSFNISQQLDIGIRYFDLRVFYKEQQKELYTYHGLTGAPLRVILNQMVHFLRKHKKEILILDFNHLYFLSPTGVKKLKKLLYSAFGRKIQRLRSVEMSLADLWRHGWNVIIFFREERPGDESEIDMTTNFAMHDGQLVSPFDQSKFYDESTWIDFLKENYRKRPQNETFFVTQGIMQPSLMSIAASSLTKAGSLETLTSDKASKLLVRWVHTCKRGTDGINIVTADFVQKHNFTETVLSLNMRNTSPIVSIRITNLLLISVLIFHICLIVLYL